MRDEVISAVVGAVDLLPAAQRDAVRLFYLHDLSHSEVAAAEAVALALRVTGTPTPRPLTYDTMASLVRAADGRIAEVALTRLQDFTYYAEAIVEGAAGSNRVDLRPSDALNLALTVGVPIRTTRGVLDDIAAAPQPFAYAEEDFPDDASVIASELQQQWTRMYEAFARWRDET